MTMTNLIKCERIIGANDATGLCRLDIEEIEPKVYRFNEAAGGMEWTPPETFKAMGWNGRTYWSLLEPTRFHVVKG
jgi:hypothetical protein